MAFELNIEIDSITVNKVNVYQVESAVKNSDPAYGEHAVSVPLEVMDVLARVAREDGCDIEEALADIILSFDEEEKLCTEESIHFPPVEDNGCESGFCEIK